MREPPEASRRAFVRTAVIGGLGLGAGCTPAGSVSGRRADEPGPAPEPMPAQTPTVERSTAMIRVRKSEERGRANHGWLDTKHTFSFANYYDPAHMGFRSLRVINEDRVIGGEGFPTHGHRDMEIISYVVGGALEHRDSMGTGSVIRPGEVQRMSAGHGVRHSEYNHSGDEDVRFLQIWIEPDTRGLEPSYEQKNFGETRRNNLRLVASRDGREGSVTVHQDMALYAGVLDAGTRLEQRLAAGRHGWLQVVRGEVTVEGEALSAGDGAAISDLERLPITATSNSEILFFDLA